MKKLATTALLVIAGALAWYLASPLFIEEIVEEDFPAVSEEKLRMIEKMENLTAEQVDAMPEEERMDMKNEMDRLAEEMPDKDIAETMPVTQEDAEPKLLLSGTFHGADAFHKGSGEALVYDLPDGRTVLRLENFSVTNGPALSVYLAKSADGDLQFGSAPLAKLKGNKGNQNYEIPQEIDPSEYRSVVIYCVPFRVVFAVAPLR